MVVGVSKERRKEARLNKDDFKYYVGTIVEGL